MKKYEGLFILNTVGKEEGIKEIIDKITSEIEGAGGKVETVQKMDKRSFSRVADKKFTGGYYVNVIFSCQGGALSQLKQRFSMNEDVFRVLFTRATVVQPAAAAA